MIAEGRGK